MGSILPNHPFSAESFSCERYSSLGAVDQVLVSLEESILLGNGFLGLPHVSILEEFWIALLAVGLMDSISI